MLVKGASGRHCHCPGQYNIASTLPYTNKITLRSMRCTRNRDVSFQQSFCFKVAALFQCRTKTTFTETERSSGWQLWYSLETLKTCFHVSSEYQGCHPDDLSVSVLMLVHRQTQEGNTPRRVSHRRWLAALDPLPPLLSQSKYSLSTRKHK